MTRIRLLARTLRIPTVILPTVVLSTLIGIGAWTISLGTAVAELPPVPRPGPTPDSPLTYERPEPRKSLSPVTAEQVLAWRKQYPFRSLAGRLAYEAKRAPKSSPPMTKDFEQALVSEEVSMSRNLRGNSLRLLHEERVEEFVARSGFGLGRMEINPRSSMFYELPESESIPLAKVSESSNDGPTLSLPSTREAAQAVGGATRVMPTIAEMQAMHSTGTSQFAGPWTVGYVKSIDQVAGFSSHRFLSELIPPPDAAQPIPKPNEMHRQKRWQLVRMELTSLLKQETPRVYVSENLPRMEDLSSTRTRELTTFETDALAKLHAGEQTVVAATANRIEMFGALRANKDCRQCHAVPQGTVLGAFSYELRRDPPVKHLPPVGAVQ